jgi:cyclophilin family peptidyl-prolyl cis-trans isomerase
MIIMVVANVFILWPTRNSKENGEAAETRPQVVMLVPPEDAPTSRTCPYQSFSDLTDEERYPTKGKRHMVTPPKGDSLTLVCCDTTAGPWSIVVHERWAPLGAKRFLEMVQGGYFDYTVPLMRCIKGFLCQFGLSSDPDVSKHFRATIKDDKNWLPEGPTHRENSEGVKRFAKGYMAYAGGGEDSRNRQLIVSLKDNKPLAGGSPWEVPWGELVGTHSFETLDKIYTGYDEKGPQQGVLAKEGMSERVRAEFPDIDFVNSCHVVDREVQEEPY